MQEYVQPAPAVRLFQWPGTYPLCLHLSIYVFLAYVVGVFEFAGLVAIGCVVAMDNGLKAVNEHGVVVIGDCATDVIDGFLHNHFQMG